MPSNRCSPAPSSTGRIARCSSSIRPARRYCRIVATPPPRRTSRPPAAARRLLQRRVNALGDEAKLRAARHRERRAAHGASARRPACDTAARRPTSPSSCRPATGRARDRTCCARESTRRCRRSPAPRCRCRRRSRRQVWPCILRQTRVWKNHSISSGPLTPSGFCEILVRAGAVAVERDAKAQHAKFRHNVTHSGDELQFSHPRNRTPSVAAESA